MRRSRLIGMSFALWFSIGSAWAGHGGADVPNALATVCSTLQNTFGVPVKSNAGPPGTNCPDLPTVTQMVLELAGLLNVSPDVIRFQNGVSPTAAINAVNLPVGDPSELSNVASLAFISTAKRNGVAAVTLPDSEDADSFFYAATAPVGQSQPTTLVLVYDFPPLRRSEFESNRFIADITVPLVVLSSAGIETEAPTTIKIRGKTGCGKKVTCISATVDSFNGGSQRLDATALGLTVNLSFKPSANSSEPHAIIEVQAPLLITAATDPVYGGTDSPGFNPASPFFPDAFTKDLSGFPRLDSQVGVAPYAVPQSSQSQPATIFPFCATIADDHGNQRAAVAAFYSISTIGMTYLSAALPDPQNAPTTCP